MLSTLTIKSMVANEAIHLLLCRRQNALHLTSGERDSEHMPRGAHGAADWTRKQTRALTSERRSWYKHLPATCNSNSGASKCAQLLRDALSKDLRALRVLRWMRVITNLRRGWRGNCEALEAGAQPVNSTPCDGVYSGKPRTHTADASPSNMPCVSTLRAQTANRTLHEKSTEASFPLIAYPPSLPHLAASRAVSDGATFTAETRCMFWRGCLHLLISLRSHVPTAFNTSTRSGGGTIVSIPNESCWYAAPTNRAWLYLGGRRRRLLRRVSSTV